jgi:type IV secretion system protein VirD4
MQSKQQLHTLYGEQGAENLFLNCGAELLFGGVDQRLAEEVSKRGGSDTIAEVSTNRPRFMGWMTPSKQSENEAAKGRPLMLPQEVQQLPRDQLLVLRRFLPPLKLRRIEWFSDPWFARLKGPPPAAPALTITVERDQAP